MKKTIAYVLAAATVVIGLVSCSKAKLPEAEQEKEQEKPQQGLRTLTVSFAAGTKTTLGPKDQPVWAEGDKISLNGVVYNVPPEAVGKETCTITTDITGSINAVYPADAYVYEPPYYKVSDQQDGSFGCANICVAKAAAGVNTLTFENVTAVFAVAVPSGTKKLTVTSLGKIDSETGRRGTEATDTVAINTTKTGSAANVIIVEKEDKSAFKDTVYVAVAVDPETGVLLADLNFDTGKAQGGVSPNYIKSKGQEPLEYKAAAGTIYTPVLHEYVVVGEEENARKWATMNVGAATSSDAGLYFMWGDTTGHSAATNGEKAFETGFDDNTKGFSWTNCPLSNHDEYHYRFSKYVPEDQVDEYGIDGKFDNKTVLDFEDDAANANWGGSWRMPTTEEFDALLTATGTTNSNFSNGVLTINDHSDLTFPAAGYGNGTNLSDEGGGYYWSSSLCAGTPEYAYRFDFVTSHFGPLNCDRYTGYSVRALSD